MLYLVLICGILLLPCGVYSAIVTNKTKDDLGLYNQRKKVTQITFLIAFVTICGSLGFLHLEKTEKIAEEEEERISNLTPRELAREEAEKLISAWDGSLIPAVSFLKEYLNDPSSFDHVETDANLYELTEDIFIVQFEMRFRAANAFGGIILNDADGFVTIDGTMIELNINDEPTFISDIIDELISEGETQPEQQTQEQVQNITPLTFEEFKIAYNQNAQRFGNKSVTDWEMSIGEKANSVRVSINDVTDFSVFTNKNDDFTLKGIFFYMSASDDMIKTLEALTTLYTLLAVFEPTFNDDEIMNLATIAVQTEASVDYVLPSGLPFLRTSLDGIDVMSFSYE